jgi:hypothetical protein
MRHTRKIIFTVAISAISTTLSLAASVASAAPVSAPSHITAQLPDTL